MGIKNVIKRAGERAGNTIARLSVLSPEQLQEMQARREAYLSEMPNLQDGTAEELTRRLMAASSVEIYGEYLKHIQDMYVPIKKDTEYDSEFKAPYNIRFLNITKWVSDKRENSLEKLVNVYEVLSNEECNIALIFHRTCAATEVYMAVTNTQNAGNNVDVENYKKRLVDAIQGNFPGVEFNSKNGKGIIPYLNNSIPYSVASASNIPGEKSEKFISQTIEKLLDGIVPESVKKEYSIILLATPIKDISERKLHLAELYSALAPYSGWMTNFTYTESDSTNSTASFGINAGVSAGVQSGQNNSVTNTSGVTDSVGSTSTESQNTTETDSSARTDTQSASTTNTESEGSSITSGTSATESSSTATGNNSSTTHTDTTGSTDSAGVTGGVQVFGIGGAGANYTHGASQSSAEAVTTGISESVTEGLANTVTSSTAENTAHSVASTIGNSVASTAGKAIAKSVGTAVANSLGRAVNKSVSTASGLYKGVNFGGNFGTNFARSSNVSATVGKNEGITQSFTNYNIKHTLEILEMQMKRYEQSSALGMWDFAAYVLSEDPNVANNVAHSYLALTEGEQSYLSQTAVNLWRGDMGENSSDAKEICSYLRELRHPVFGLNPELTSFDSEWNVYPGIVTAATNLSGKELAYSLNFPQKSVTGFPVLGCAEFGRNVITYDSAKKSPEILLGTIFHMNHDEDTPVKFNLNSLASHTFITGSTGSGKSNTVCQIIDEAYDQNVRFMVIEPAKGEYKDIFGNYPGVKVYGTNPYLSPLLRINPFSFTEKTHIFEHIDRLTEIFNMCWPMYAAMPAVLKAAIENAYEKCGWDLMKSVNRLGENIFPTFADVADQIKKIIDASEYDTENKGAYKGALLTRLQSLTNGINGILFVADEIEPEVLFDEDVIVDLSRVGSSETKALIMGILVLKLQEYRMSMQHGKNKELRHITVLEEAHNLLRRNPVSHATDGGNFLEKSVEMISNAIAEMRTYGEGFVIVDQAPGLVDMAAIRNTNTKIIMRLPDANDRELVGRSANLNDDQITELAKLPCGVAAVYQNDWVQPVLCKVKYFDDGGETYSFESDPDVFGEKNENGLSESLLDYIMNAENFKQGLAEKMKDLTRRIVKSKMASEIKVDFLEYISAADDDSFDAFRKLIFDFLNAQKAIENASHCNEMNNWVEQVVRSLEPPVVQYSKRQINLALALILYEQARRDATYNELFCAFTEQYMKTGRVY